MPSTSRLQQHGAHDCGSKAVAFSGVNGIDRYSRLRRTVLLTFEYVAPDSVYPDGSLLISDAETRSIYSIIPEGTPALGDSSDGI